MMGYDKLDAVKVITYKLSTAHGKLGIPLESLVAQAIELDVEFMKLTGVIDQDGYEGDGYYDDDDAYEFMLDNIISQRGLPYEMEAPVAFFLADFMEAQQQYFESKGLISWDE